MAATAGIVSLSAGYETQLYPPVGGGTCTIFMVKVRSTQSYPAKIRIPSLHAETDYFWLYPGQVVQFHSVSNGITAVYAISGGAGSTTVEYAVIGKY